METPPEATQKATLGDYLAAERTLLAWIRTGLALMGFGFVVARFGLFLEQLQAIRGAPSTEHFGLSLWFGTALIAVGVLVSVLAGVHHMRLVRRLDDGESGRPHRAIEAVVIAFLLALIGLGMAAYLISVRSTTRSQPGNSKETSMTRDDTGIVDIPSHHPVDETVEKIRGSHAWRALRHRNFRLFFGGQSISLIGTWMTRIATRGWSTGSRDRRCCWARSAFAGQIPTFLCPFAGVWVDRLDRAGAGVDADALHGAVARAGRAHAFRITSPSTGFWLSA
jgi:putative membrane protein